jgi:hypothetical protein
VPDSRLTGEVNLKALIGTVGWGWKWRNVRLCLGVVVEEMGPVLKKLFQCRVKSLVEVANVRGGPAATVAEINDDASPSGQLAIAVAH